MTVKQMEYKLVQLKAKIDARQAELADWKAQQKELKERFELSPLGEGKVGNHEAVGVRVAYKGHRDIKLFFDKKTGLQLKNERLIKDQMLGGQERTQETLHSDYKDINGFKQPMKLVIKRDGEKHLEGEVTDLQMGIKIDDAVFAKP